MDKKLKVVAFNGSPRKNGNTHQMLKKVCETLTNEGFDTELVHICGQAIQGCRACRQCSVNKDEKCVNNTDPVNDWIGKMIEADGIILASPTYFADLTAEMKALIDRAGCVTRANGSILKRKIGAAVVCHRRAGAIHVFDSINHFFLIGQMIVSGSSYWNLGLGLAEGDVENDAEGMTTMTDLGKNMAWLLGKIS